MAHDDSRLRERIEELEQEIAAKDAELAQTRLRLNAANARLEQIIDQISQELKMAGKIQKLLAPVEIPHIQGFEFSTRFVPGMKSGGDYFDIFEHKDKMRFGVVVASCSGYAMSALFLSVLIKISSRMEARSGLEPHEMVTLLGKELTADMQLKDRAQLFYGVVDRRDFVLRYCSMGQIKAYIQLNGQDALTPLEISGPSLSKDFNTQPQTATLSLNPKDRLILCTEGISQAKSSRGEVWGEERLIDAIRSAPRTGVHELRNEVLYRCEAFTGLSEPDRDQTLLVLEVKDKVIKLAKN